MTKLLKRLFTLGIRKNKRFKAREGVYVVMGNSLVRNQISNISMGGLAFNYEDDGYVLGKGYYELKLVSDRQQKVDKISFRRVADYPMGEVLYPYRKVKCFSVHFEGLTRGKRVQLKHFIQNQTIGRV